MKNKLKKLNNKAFTLVEILLAISLLAIAIISIGAIIINTQNGTAQMLNDANLQQQLNEIKNTIQDDILSTNADIKYLTKLSGGSFLITNKEDENTNYYEKLLVLYDLNQQNYELTKTYYLYNSETKLITTAKTVEIVPVESRVNSCKDYIASDIISNLNSINADWNIVASYIETFSFDFSSYDISRLISYNLTIKRDSTSYSTDKTIFIRNS